MSYTALYRKYRPDTFEEVKGQDHVVTTLQNQIRADRIGHAYLFCGTRGTGKTSVAKIFAKAVNCLHPENGSPCGTCECCRSIADGSSMNVIEIDAASNNGVDNIRQIREEVSYSPTSGKYKVYIIDEVHMLSPGAFNALLKTLEEPPSYVIFILATTEVRKIPVTIVSRCQRYDFHRISPEEIARRLTDLLKREQVEAEEKAVRFIARKADGGMRDALSLTDQCISFYLGQELTYDKVLNILGAVDMEVLGRMFRSILDQDVAQVIRQLEDLVFRGRDLLQLATDFTEYLRDLLLLQTTEGAAELLEVSDENLALMREEAQMADEDTLMRCIRLFSDLGNQMRYAANRRVTMEIALIRMCRPQMERDVGSLAVRIGKLEKMMEEGYVPSRGSGDQKAAGSQQIPSAARKPEPAFVKAVPEDLQQIKDRWGEIVESVRTPLLRHGLQKAVLKFDTAPGQEGRIFLVLKDVTAQKLIGDKDALSTVRELISDKIGKNIDVRMIEEQQEGETGLHLQEIEVMRRARSRINMEIENESVNTQQVEALAAGTVRI